MKGKKTTNKNLRIHGVVTNKAIGQLPSQPRMLVHLLDALQRDADPQDIADLVSQDAVLSSQVLTAANASKPPCNNIEQALQVLGDSQFHTLLVSHGIRQFFHHGTATTNQALQLELWKNALFCAHFARVLATLTSYQALDEAYLCGLLANIGQLALLEEYDQAYESLLQDQPDATRLTSIEQQQFNQTHNDLAADLVESWQLSGFMADAIRYQHEPLEQIRDAHHLVKIIHCARIAATADEVSPQLIDTAEQLFGLNEALTRELYSRNVGDIEKLALSLQINSDESFAQARGQLGLQLAELSELSQISSGILQAGNLDELSAAIDQCLMMSFGISRSVLFHHDEAQKLLSTQQPGSSSHAEFKLSLEPGRSLAADSLLDKKPLESTDKQVLTVIDRQLQHYCQGETLFCWPLLHGEQVSGVLVFAIDKDRLDDLRGRHSLLGKLCKQIAQSLAIQLQDSGMQASERGNSSSAYQHKIREAVHEASNPLSIIHNYLEMLRIKLGDEHEANESLGLIKEEIERVGNILNKLREQPEAQQPEQETLNVNRVIEDTAQIIKESICVAKDLTLQLHLDKQMVEIQGDSNHLKQILTNLLKNSAEALSKGGQISVSSDTQTSFNGRDCLSISVADNGPGLPDEVKKKLFHPLNSSKGKAHSGLGLSIVKKLVDEMNGYIVCHSNENTGTEFQILLPKTLND